MNSFWDFALTQWQKPQVEALALDVQRQHGPVVYFLLGAWLAERGQPYTPPLLASIKKKVEPVEAQLTKMRGERSTLTGADKQAALAKELALEKQLYQQLARMVPAPDSTVNPSRFCWWHQFFPHCDEAQFSIWRTTLGLD